MKKSSIFIIGILAGTLFLSQPLLSGPVKVPYGTDKETTEIKVFPNPSDGRFQLVVDYSGKEKVTAKVFDITGKMVKNITEELEIGETSVTANIDLEAPSSGIYFIRIEMGKQLLTKKIIIR
jgi:hypothetical protein